MRILGQTGRSLIEIFKRRRMATLQPVDQHLHGPHEAPCEELEAGVEYGDGFISRMIQLSQMPRIRSPRDRNTFSIRPVPTRPAYGV